jgi:anti-anti-sigma factor
MEAGEAQHGGRVTQHGPLEVESRRQNESWLVEARGEIDSWTIETLEAELQQHSDLPVVLDLSGIEFMDSAGIKLLMAPAGRLTVEGVSSPIQRLIRICGFEAEIKYSPPRPN